MKMQGAQAFRALNVTEVMMLELEPAVHVSLFRDLRAGDLKKLKQAFTATHNESGMSMNACNMCYSGDRNEHGQGRMMTMIILLMMMMMMMTMAMMMAMMMMCKLCASNGLTMLAICSRGGCAAGDGAVVSRFDLPFISVCL